MIRPITSVVAVAMIAASCTSSEGPADAVDTVPVSNASVASAPADQPLDDFCVQFNAAQGERPESYVGSTEHLADLESMLAVAPAEVSESMTIIRDFVASGAIDSANDPDSNLFDNWPDAVRDAVGEIQSFGANDC